jgi:hypothetical protein
VRLGRVGGRAVAHDGHEYTRRAWPLSARGCGRAPAHLVLFLKLPGLPAVAGVLAAPDEGIRTDVVEGPSQL